MPYKKQKAIRSVKKMSVTTNDRFGFIPTHLEQSAKTHKSRAHDTISADVSSRFGRNGTAHRPNCICISADAIRTRQPPMFR